MGKVTAVIRVANDVWIATARLQRVHLRAADFSLKGIEVHLVREGLTEGMCGPLQAPDTRL